MLINKLNKMMEIIGKWGFFHISLIVFTILSSSCTSSSNNLVTEISTNLEKYTVMSDGHPLALWSKKPEESKGAILFIPVYSDGVILQTGLNESVKGVLTN